eukprot:10037820-Lingulodinium_polyedra.AAC.1
MDATKALQKERMANYHWCIAFDAAWREGTGHGLSMFMPETKLQWPSEGENWTLEELECPVSGQMVVKACIENKQKVKTPALQYAGGQLTGCTPVLHMVCDVGSIGMP